MNTILFDLDGTLLSLDQDRFLELYFQNMGIMFAKLGYEPKSFLKAVYAGTGAMLKNDGKKSNEQVFWDVFSQLIPVGKDLENQFITFYQNEFDKAQAASSCNPLAKKCIQILKEKGYRLILATNPLFPPVATHKRIKWAGLEPSDFEWITTYDNSRFCKPNPKYYESLVEDLHLDPSQCMMVGNDITDDLPAKGVGMDFYLLLDNLINSNNVDFSSHQQGYFTDFYQLVQSLPTLKSSFNG